MYKLELSHRARPVANSNEQIFTTGEPPVHTLTWQTIIKTVTALHPPIRSVAGFGKYEYGSVRPLTEHTWVQIKQTVQDRDGDKSRSWLHGDADESRPGSNSHEVL